PKSVANDCTSGRPTRRYGAGLPPRPAPAGYQASTSTCRGSSAALNVSRRAVSMTCHEVVPTGYRPVGAGSSNGAVESAVVITAIAAATDLIATALRESDTSDGRPMTLVIG